MIEGDVDIGAVKGLSRSLKLTRSSFPKDVCGNLAFFWRRRRLQQRSK
jgi:hypothetical protein